MKLMRDSTPGQQFTPLSSSIHQVNQSVLFIKQCILLYTLKISSRYRRRNKNMLSKFELVYFCIAIHFTTNLKREKKTFNEIKLNNNKSSQKCFQMKERNPYSKTDLSLYKLQGINPSHYKYSSVQHYSLLLIANRNTKDAFAFLI